MTRKQFLLTIALLLLTITGINNMMNTIEPVKTKKKVALSPKAFGSSTYGGV